MAVYMVFLMLQHTVDSLSIDNTSHMGTENIDRTVYALLCFKKNGDGYGH